VSVLVIFVLQSLSPDPAFAATTKRVFPVSYVSSEHVYLQGGRLDGLAVGDRLIIQKNDTLAIVLEIVFLSDHSASCNEITPQGQVTSGLRATLISDNSVSDTTKSPPLDTLPEIILNQAPPKVAAIAPRTKPNISGTISVAYDRWIDKTNRQLDFGQSTLRLGLKARRIAGKELTFSIRTRGRYDQRSRSFTSSAAQKPWMNRIYELSLTYDDKNAPVNISIGRIPIRRMASAGYVDGFALEYRVYGPLRTGAYVGSQPTWQYSESNLSLRKYGFYVNYTKGSYQTALFEMTLAGAGEYHRTTTNREVIHAQTHLSLGNRLSVSQASEVDVNRGWRRTRVGNAISVSSAHVDTRFRFNNWLSVGVNYDNRKNYWTYEQRTMADSLFDDHLSKGIRSRVDVRLPGSFLAGFSVGYRKRTGDPRPTYSYTTNVSKSGLALAHSNLNLQYSGFSGPSQNGSNMSVRIGEYFRQRDYVSLGYGFYNYRTSGSAQRRLNHWFESTMWIAIVENFFLNGLYHYEMGDDLRGHRLQLELGRFF
jgi:hypothetical protein